MHQRSDDFDCQSKLKHYGTGYALYLEDNENQYPYRYINRNGSYVKNAQIHWAQVVWTYQDMFQYGGSMNTTPTIQCRAFVRIGEEKGYEFPFNYRGYTGVYFKRVTELDHSPSEVAVVGDGVIAWPNRGYSYHFISQITEARINDPNATPSWGNFRLSDFIHTGQSVNASFADMSVKNMTPEYMIYNRDKIFNR